MFFVNFEFVFSGIVIAHGYRQKNIVADRLSDAAHGHKDHIECFERRSYPGMLIGRITRIILGYGTFETRCQLRYFFFVLFVRWL